VANPRGWADVNAGFNLGRRQRLILHFLWQSRGKLPLRTGPIFNGSYSPKERSRANRRLWQKRYDKCGWYLRDFERRGWVYCLDQMEFNRKAAWGLTELGLAVAKGIRLKPKDRQSFDDEWYLQHPEQYRDAP
jgi:hypothetical protein